MTYYVTMCENQHQCSQHIQSERIDERLDTWRNQPNQAYGSALTASNIPDPYLSNYYALHCYNQGVSDGTWSSGGDPMFLGPIGREQPPPYMDGRLFGQNNFGSFNQGFAYLPATGGDYSAWSNSALNPRKAGMQNDNHEDYYSRDIYNAPAYQTTIKHLEHRIDGISLQTPHQNSYQFFKDGYGKSDAMIGTESRSNDTHFGKKGGVFPMPTSGITLNEQPSVHKKLSWASIASKPAKSQSKAKSKSVSQTSTLAGKQNSNSMDIGTWDNKNGNNDGNNSTNKIELPSSQVHSSPWNSPRESRHSNNQQYDISHPVTENSTASPFFDKQFIENNYNPKELDINTKNARFFIIKSYSEDDVYRSIKYSVWCSTEHGNKRLDAAYRENEDKGAVYLFYSVNASGHFCGMAEMVSPVDYASDSGIWAQDKWKGQFNVKWIYVKDVPNSSLRHIRLENNENKPVTNSRDTQEVPLDKGEQVLKIIHNYKSDTSIFDDKNHYEMRQKEEEKRKTRSGQTKNCQGR